MTDRATESLRAAILRGDLAPDQLHAVHTVADMLGVSRTPVREALIRLAADGMVKVQRNRGFIVLRHSARDLREIFSLRLILEVPATRAAAKMATDDDVAALEADIEKMRAAMDNPDPDPFLRADRQFHRTLLEIGDNMRLAEFVDSLRNVVLSTGVSTANRSESIEEILEPHVEILGFVRARDPEGAAESMRGHITSTARKLIAQEFGDEEADSFNATLAQLEIPT